MTIHLSELSRTTGVPVPSIKYYLRERLLPSGVPTGRTRARYDESHVRRLRLIRALREVGDLPIEAIRRVTAALDDPDLSLHQVLGVAHHALAPPPPPEDPPELVEVEALLGRLGWRVSAGAPAKRGLAAALASLRSIGDDVDAGIFLRHAEAVGPLAELEIASLPVDEGPDRAVERAVVGTVVFDAALRALRLLAQEHHSATRLGPQAEDAT
jgi:DNA-binding transcriptional MerR regulator